MNKLAKEYQFFKQQEPNMRILLVTNMFYALVLPVVEIFVGAYVMRSTSDPAMVAFYQLAMYIGIVTTSLLNGFLLRKYSVKALYSAGILVSGISMYLMMTIKSLGFTELAIAGFFMGAASGFFWTNRYLLALNNTTDDNRNYFFGLESFFFSLSSIGVPLVIGAFISLMDGREVLGIAFDITKSYQVVTLAVVIITIIACCVLWKGNFENPGETNFLYFKFIRLWKKMLAMAALKGMVQGFLVTAPAILVLKLVGDEGILGVIQGVSGALTALLVYILGRIARPEDRIKIFVSGLVLFFIGTLLNGLLYSAVGVILFVLCKVIFQPLFDLAYFPIMMRTIDVVAKIEKRNEYAYILSHEFGLFLGRASGLILFLVLAYGISQDFALKYALIVVAGLQLLAYPLAKNIIKHTDTN
ncbi:major facilitator superfamily MFS_1 [Phocaeicola salanitronis DSM 18170]|uniref:Major facilitator superfamily MFS_1 n=1 Tax=Phocaeicola salanitronis (strain DSM 18170 / JCM 13657 / CCUG 60908 / BL78) TaxID=667015 RepID=F0QZL1_PHOSB|nr:MFS transporter [Phocaeicola salanitronis]ADY36112.1 major facilitator superfamily MFS_1 [Phocaeicola salanitronis DSM 18170]